MNHYFRGFIATFGVMDS